MECTADDCTRQANVPGGAKGLCPMHYQRLRKWGSTTAVHRRGSRELLEDRFLRWVDKQTTAGCWLWTGAINNKGYGVFKKLPDKETLAHRWAYRLFVGLIPEGCGIDHTCHSLSGCSGNCLHPRCVNPAHLEPVTQKQNMQRSSSNLGSFNRNKTHCKHGHEFSPENTYLWRGRRNCRACAQRR